MNAFVSSWVQGLYVEEGGTGSLGRRVNRAWKGDGYPIPMKLSGEKGMATTTGGKRSEGRGAVTKGYRGGVFRV